MLADSETVAALEEGESRAWADFYAAMPTDLRDSLGAECHAFGGALGLRMRGIDYADFNRVIGLGVARSLPRTLLEEIVEWYQSAGLKQFLLHLPPSRQQEELRTWMLDLRLKPRRTWVKMYRRMEPPDEIHTRFQVREAGAGDAMRLGEAACAGFGMSPGLAPWVASLVGREGWRHFLAWDGNEVVAGGSLYLFGSTAWLGLASTRPEYRRAGAQGAIMTARIRAAITAGVRLIYTEAAHDSPRKPNPSYHNMLRAGFSLGYIRENYGLG